MRYRLSLANIFLISTAIHGATIYVPQIADSSQIRTSFILYETGGNQAEIKVSLTDGDGSPLALDFGSHGVVSEFEVLLERREVMVLESRGTGQGIPGAARFESRSDFGVSAIFTLLTKEGEFLAETGIPGVLPAASSALPVDLSEDFNTGVAIHNAGKGSTSVHMTLYDQEGQAIGTHSFDLAVQGHISKYVGGLDGFFKGLLEHRGKLVIESDRPLVSCALRQHSGRLNLTAFPVESRLTGRNQHFIPQVGDGVFPDGILKTGFVVMNLSSEQAKVSISFNGDDGSPFEVTIGDVTDNNFDIGIPAHGTRFLETDGSGGGWGALQVGSATIRADQTIGATGIYTLLDEAGTFRTESGVGSAAQMIRMVLPVLDEYGIYTGVAFFNPGPEPNQVELRIHGNNFEFKQALETAESTLNLSPWAHRSEFVAERFGPGIVGTLQVEGSNSLAMMGVRMRQDPLWYTMIPLSQETSFQGQNPNLGVFQADAALKHRSEWNGQGITGKED